MYLHFAYAIMGRPFDSEGEGVQALCENKYLPAIWGEEGGSANFSQIFRLASVATVKFSNNYSGSLRSQF